MFCIPIPTAPDKCLNPISNQDLCDLCTSIILCTVLGIEYLIIFWKCNYWKCFVHPHNVITTWFPYLNRNKRMENMILFRKESWNIRKTLVVCALMQSDKLLDGDVRIEI
jgi:hypothetical protein